MDKIYFKISEVAKMTGMTRRNLLFYDKEGILKPAYYDENNGYRYYSLEQTHQIRIINILREFDVPLKDIQLYMNSEDGDKAYELVNNLKIQMRRKLDKMENYYKFLSLKEFSLEQTKSITDFSEIIIDVREPFDVLCSNELTTKDQENHYEKAFEFQRELKNYGILSLTEDAIIKKEYLTTNYQDIISYFCVNLKDTKEYPSKRTIPGGIFAVIYYKGDYENSGKAIIELIEYIKNIGYVVDGDAYLKGLISHLDEKDESKHIMEIAIKVKEKSVV